MPCFLTSSWSAALLSTLVFLCTAAAPWNDDFLPSLLASVKARALGALPQEQELCSLDPHDGRQNFFLVWPYFPEQFTQQAYSTLESVLFHHPAANVVIVSAGAEPRQLDAYLLEGYCVAFAYISLEIAERLFQAAAPPELAKALMQRASRLVFTDDGAYLSLLNGVVLALQVLYGGVSLHMDGLLLNPPDLWLPRQLSLQHTAVFLEQLLPSDGPEDAEALQAEDFEKSWLPRSHADRADGRTFACLDLVCPRALPAGGAMGQALLQTWLQYAMAQGIDLNRLATMLYRAYVRARDAQKGLPVQTDLLTFDHEVVLLPYWVVVEPHFPDSWKAYGGRDGLLTEHTQLFSPRPQRESTDWTLVSSSKLWLPLTYGPPSARNVLPRSVMDLALRRFTLGVMPVPYARKTFGAPRAPPGSGPGAGLGQGAVSGAGPGTGRRLTSPKDSPVEFDLGTTAAAQHEAALPGAIGGFRTFRHVRLVGRDRDRQGQGQGTQGQTETKGQGMQGQMQTQTQGQARMRVRVSSPRDLDIFCRQEARPLHSRAGSESEQVPARASAAFRTCSAALQPPRRRDTRGRNLLFEACGSPAKLNAALSLLAYAPVPGLARPPPSAGGERGEAAEAAVAAAAAAPGLEHRLSGEELAQHFAALHLEAWPSPSCADSDPELEAAATSVELAALLDDPEEHITVVAHCAERCHLLDRLAASFRDVYPNIRVVATCECSEEEACAEPVPRPHPTIPAMTVVSVPYDFGLSRGKALLARMAQTEFVLVLDDDFVHSFHSCLECMLWRMRSRYHSLWRPFDVLGFPVLEDERNFGAFRGRLRVTSHQLFLEPIIEQITPDGCMRVDICPMVFLARTERFRIFRFSEDLRVGEHEKFFYSNAYFGMQVAVCMDSSFPHFRVNTMSAGYVKRRERMQQLMLSAFKNLGFERAMFLFRKYSQVDSRDHEELLDQSVPPWYISDDTCGQRPAPPVPFAQLFILVLSTADAAGARYRHILRGKTDAEAVWLQRFLGLGDGMVRWVFAVTAHEDPAPPESVVRERDEFQDIILLSHGNRPQASLSETSAEQLLHVIALLRDFQFRWLLVLQQDVFLHFERFLGILQTQEPPHRKVLGYWEPASEVPAPSEVVIAQQATWKIAPQLVAFSRDVFALLASPEVNSMLKSAGSDFSLGDVTNLSGGLSSWLRALAVSRVALPGMHLERQGAEVEAGCPAGTLALHPVSPEQLYVLSQNPRSAAC